MLRCCPPAWLHGLGDIEVIAPHRWVCLRVVQVLARPVNFEAARAGTVTMVAFDCWGRGDVETTPIGARWVLAVPLIATRRRSRRPWRGAPSIAPGLFYDWNRLRQADEVSFEGRDLGVLDRYEVRESGSSSRWPPRTWPTEGLPSWPIEASPVA